jgi:hypothetical protein
VLLGLYARLNQEKMRAQAFDFFKFDGGQPNFFEKKKMTCHLKISPFNH